MIIEGIINSFVFIFSSVFSFLPDISIDFTNFAPVINDLALILQYVFYLFPMDTVMFCISINISIQLFRIVISFIKTLWQLLPIV